jgi:predicted nucleic acid-binding Zn ribbon protein
MPVYLYFCTTHSEIELEHHMDEIIEECPKCKEEGLPPQKLKRLIPSGTTFILNGGGWASSGYSSSK